MVYNSQCCSLYENIYGLKLRVKGRFHKLETKLIFLKSWITSRPEKTLEFVPDVRQASYTASFYSNVVEQRHIHTAKLPWRSGFLLQVNE